METREELIQLCEDAVVPCEKWENRNSYIAQLSIQYIYEGLTAGLDFRVVQSTDDPHYHSSTSMLIIEFIQPIDKKKITEEGKYLQIDSRDDYFYKMDSEREGEMFDGDGIDFDSTFTQTYMPSRARLDAVAGDDWY